MDVEAATEDNSGKGMTQKELDSQMFAYLSELTIKVKMVKFIHITFEG